MTFVPGKFWLATRIDQGIDNLINDKRPERNSDSPIPHTGETLSANDKQTHVISQMYKLLDKELVDRILEDFKAGDFKNVSSVKKPIRFATGDTRSSYSIAERTSLYDHTFNVAYAMLERFHVDTDKVNALLYALLHDAGKSIPLSRKYNLPENDRHEYSSAQYASLLLSNTRYKPIAQQLGKCLMSAGTKESVTNHYYSVLSECDRDSRHQEAVVV